MKRVLIFAVILSLTAVLTAGTGKTSKLVFKGIEVLSGHTAEPMLKEISPEEPIILKPNESRRIKIHFNIEGLEDSPRIRFAYKLDGNDVAWNSNGNTRFATYTNLSPGYYTFMVKGSDEYGTWNDEVSSFQFQVTAPFYKTAWFSLFLLAAFYLVFIFPVITRYRRRIRQLENRIKELDQKDM